MKTVIFLCLMAIGSQFLNAQNGYYPPQGTTLTYHNLDKKGKVTSTNVLTLESVNESDNGVEIVYSVALYDRKEKLTYSDRITMEQVGDKMYFDMSSFVNKGALQQDGKMMPSVKAEGNGMEVPLSGSAGDILPDASLTISADMGFIPMKMTANVVNRQIDAFEEITVPAGTFSCMKISGELNSKVLGISSSGKYVDWYAKGVGLIQSENYDKKGNLSSSSRLVSLVD